MLFDDSEESIADSDREDGDIQKMLTSPLCVQSASGKSSAALSSEFGNLIRRSVFRYANPSNLRGFLLEGITCSIRQDQTWGKQELHVESLNKCTGEQQRQTEEQRLALQDAQYGFAESRRGQVRPQEDLSLKEKVFRNTQIRNMHEIGEIKRGQEQQVDEVSVQKFIEYRETIQQVTSQLQQMRDQVNSVNDSGDGILLKWKVVSRFQLSRTKHGEWEKVQGLLPQLPLLLLSGSLRSLLEAAVSSATSLVPGASVKAAVRQERQKDEYLCWRRVSVRSATNFLQDREGGEHTGMFRRSSGGVFLASVKDAKVCSRQTQREWRPNRLQEVRSSVPECSTSRRKVTDKQTGRRQTRTGGKHSCHRVRGAGDSAALALRCSRYDHQLELLGAKSCRSWRK